MTALASSPCSPSPTPLSGPAAGAAARRPTLTVARVPWTREIDAVDEQGLKRRLAIPEERALTVFVDRQEIVTLMTLGQQPELLVLGYLFTQGLVQGVDEVASVTVDWAVGAAAVRLRDDAPSAPRLADRIARRVVTTGCGQGSVMAEVLESLPPALSSRALAAQVQHEDLVAAFDQLRRRPSVHREAGSVHGTALFRGARLLAVVEDVGRHNAVDTLAGWMLMQSVDSADAMLCTTGRLTSEMVLKAARLGVPVVASRNGLTAMGHALAERLGLTLIGRANGRRYLVYTGAHRLCRVGDRAAPDAAEPGSDP